MTEHELVKQAQEFFRVFQCVNWDEKNCVGVQPGLMVALSDGDFYSHQISNLLERNDDWVCDRLADMVAEMAKNSGIEFYCEDTVKAWHNRDIGECCG